MNFISENGDQDLILCFISFTLMGILKKTSFLIRESLTVWFFFFNVLWFLRGLFFLTFSTEEPFLLSLDLNISSLDLWIIFVALFAIISLYVEVSLVKLGDREIYTCMVLILNTLNKNIGFRYFSGTYIYNSLKEYNLLMKLNHETVKNRLNGHYWYEVIRLNDLIIHY